MQFTIYYVVWLGMIGCRYQRSKNG
jgi:hypothetical protein